MKKNLLILAVAGLALASCSNDETVAVNQSDANAISFLPNVNGVTRAADIDAGTGANGLKTIGFYVTAAHTTATPTLYFADQHYKLASTGPDVWKPTDDNGSSWKTIYWPDGSDVLDFHAYAPVTGTQLVVSNTNIGTLNGCPEYTVTPAATTDATSADSQIDFIYATLTDKDNADGSMNLAFNHEESKISINLKNTDAALTITVSEVALCNIVPSGTFKNRDASPSTSTTMGWGDFGSPLTTYYQTLASATTYTTSAAAGSSWILIPHTLAKPTTDGKYTGSTTGDGYDGAYIRVKMKVQSATDANVYYAGAASGANQYVSAIWPISKNSSATTWAAGTHYTYTIDLKGGGYYETNQDSGTDLDRVLNLHEITFATVTVSDWTDGGNTDVGM